MKPLYITYYTEGNGYDLVAEKYLIGSLKKLNLEYHLETVPHFNSWLGACRFKADYITKIAHKFPDRQIIWLDVDLKVYEDPTEYFVDLLEKCDIAMPIENGNIFNSSVVVLNNNVKCKLMLEVWLEYQRRFPSAFEQFTLQMTIEFMRQFGIRFKGVDQKHCSLDFIYRIKNPTKCPVIESFGAHAGVGKLLQGV